MRSQHSRIYLLLFILLLTPTHLICNQSRSRYFILHTGFWLPFDRGYRDDWVPKPSIGTGIEYQFNTNTSVIVSTSYSRFNYVGSSPNVPIDAIVLGVIQSKNSFATSVELKHAPNSRKGSFHPYMKGGLGYHSENISHMKVTYHDFYRDNIFTTGSDETGAMSEGIFYTYSFGIDIGLSNSFSSFFEIKFLFDLSDSDMPYLPIIGGVRF